MEVWTEEQLHALLSSQEEAEFFDSIAKIARGIGFDYCSYGLRAPLPISQPKIVLHNNYPDAWQQRYRERNYLAVDPTVDWGMRSLEPLAWPGEMGANSPEFWEEAQAYGLGTGWAQATIGANGTRGMLTLARDGSPAEIRELRELSLKLSWLAQVAHAGMSRTLLKKSMPETAGKLSQREIEVLRWTAEGKTSGEISVIIGITERTVNFHINNSIAKLHTNNKTSAVVRAVVLGYLS